MGLGIPRGAMLALVATQLHSSRDLRQPEPTLLEREQPADDFAGAAGLIAAEFSITNWQR